MLCKEKRPLHSQQIDENDKQIKLEQKKLEEIAERQQLEDKQYKLEEASKRG